MTTPADEPADPRAARAEAPQAGTPMADELAEAREQLAGARRQRHAFLAGLAHDLRNPLAPLSNGLELMRLTDADPAGRLRTRGIMERQVANLMRIADNLSELARLTGESPNLQSAEFTLGELARLAAEGARPGLQARDIALVVEVDDASAGTRLRGDAQRLAEGIGQLLDDLARHSEQGTSIRLSAPSQHGDATLVVEPGDAAAADGATLEDVQPSAFGLGVALCEQVFLLHRGHVRVQRPAGARRARFTAVLPVPEAAGAAPPAPRSASAGVGRDVSAFVADTPLAVLLADDNVDFSRSFATMLELLGHRVAIVHDGMAAVQSIVDAPPDIAFIDVGMPSLDGFAAVQRVRAHEHAADVMLVAVTGRGGAEDRARAAECGYDRYLVKPFSMQEVRDALDAAQARRAAAPEQGRGRPAPGVRAT